MAISWDKTFIKMAQAIALRSKDPSTKVGSILVSPDKREIACGYNGFPSRIYDDERVLAKKNDIDINRYAIVENEPFNCSYELVDHSKGLNKYDLIIHAEQNAILNCHVRPEGWTLYCTHIPCPDCAKAIIGSGIVKVVCKKQKGKSQMNYHKTTIMFEIAKVAYTTI